MKNFRAITGSGDWIWGQGTASYFKNEQAIAADIQTSILFWLNDFFAAMDKGIDWSNLLGSKNPAATQNVLLQVRTAILGVEGVTRINSVSAVTNKARKLTITWDVSTIFSANLAGQTPVF